MTIIKKGNIFGAEANGYGWDQVGNISAKNVNAQGGVVQLKESATPDAETNSGKIYTKTDNKMYFQDGAGTEHEIAYVP